MQHKYKVLCRVCFGLEIKLEFFKQSKSIDENIHSKRHQITCVKISEDVTVRVERKETIDLLYKMHIPDC